ncbi:hypothetical protein L195_g033077 [Trifolium pratense]|uniref:Uncharacterized protein n=1 Tax=Trifolium pratense TaxID=57577 RepID=A0A2K3LF08_TRIPR|nr:hypothetical protein L195_g033077 [Trifolium pratense]
MVERVVRVLIRVNTLKQLREGKEKLHCRWIIELSSYSCVQRNYATLADGFLLLSASGAGRLRPAQQVWRPAQEVLRPAQFKEIESSFVAVGCIRRSRSCVRRSGSDRMKTINRNLISWEKGYKIWCTFEELKLRSKDLLQDSIEA